MKDNELLFDRKCHVLYSKPCKKEIRAKIALHYPEVEREAIDRLCPLNVSSNVNSAVVSGSKFQRSPTTFACVAT